MLRGILSGVIWGVLVSGVVLSVASLLSGMGQPMDRATPAETSKPVEEIAAAPATDISRKTPKAPETPKTDVTAAAEPDVDVQPAAAVPDPVVVPDEAVTEAPANASVDLPVGSSFNREAPDAPATLPDTDSDIVAAAAPRVAAPSENALDAPVLGASPSAPTGLVLAPAAAPAAPRISTEGGAVEITRDDPVLPAGQSAAPSTPSQDTPPQAPQIASRAQPNALSDGTRLPQIGTPDDDTQAALTIDDGAASTVTTNRLPRIGDASQEQADEEPTPSLIPALEAYAKPFDNAEAKPILSVLLIDQTPRPDADQLRFFPFPVSFAVDPMAPDAKEAMRHYRQAGFEVAMLVNMPKSAKPSDVETSFAVFAQSLPETVAVVDAPGSDMQANRDVMNQVVEILKESGHGLVTQSKGLNAARQIADREGVPAKVIFRSIDAKGETPKVMRRFLDQAAFRAAQEPGVILVGHARPETIATLVEWGVQGRAQQVALAPLSAALMAQ